MKIETTMKRKVITVRADATIAQAAKIIASHRAGILPVLDEEGKPVGMIQLKDLISLVMPGFLNILDNVDFISDFGMLEMLRPDHASLDQPVTTIMEPLMTIDQGSGLLRAYITMLQHDLFDLVVTDHDGKLVGLVSRVDIGTAIIHLWSLEKK